MRTTTLVAAALVAGSIAVVGCSSGSGGKSGTPAAGGTSAGGTSGGGTIGRTASGTTSSGVTSSGTTSHGTTATGTTSAGTSTGTTSAGTSTGTTSAGTTSGGAVITPRPLPSGPVGGPAAQGSDVSKYEGTVDWTKVANAGQSFSIARVSDGLHYPDAYFAPDWSGMKAHGVVRGVYQFFRGSQDPIAQADYLIAQVGSIGPGDLPPFADVETLDNVSAAQNVTNLRLWIDRIKTQLGVTPAIYSSRRVWTMLGSPTGFSDCDLWVANWGVSSPAIPAEWKAWMFWQYTSSAQINGITGSPGVDADQFAGTSDDLKFYAGLPAPAGFIRGLAPDHTGSGYWTCAVDGGVFPYGDATYRGNPAGQTLPEPVLGIVRTPTGLGYWLFGADGAVYTFGDAVAAGNLAGHSLAAPIVGMAATPTGLGYWLVGRDGSVSPFGDAQTQGQPAQPTSAVVGIAATPTGRGYTLLSADGNVYNFGDAPQAGSSLGKISQAAVGIAGTITGRGYWIVEADGSVQNFGDAGLFFYNGSLSLNAPIVGITSSLTSLGYWLVAEDGTVFELGDAVYGGGRAR